MIESGYYPAGAEFDPNAPYNQSDPEPMEFEKEIQIVVTCLADVESEDYEVYNDDEGVSYGYGGDVVKDFENSYMPLNETAQVAIDTLQAKADELREKHAKGVEIKRIGGNYTRYFWHDKAAEAEYNKAMKAIKTLKLLCGKYTEILVEEP